MRARRAPPVPSPLAASVVARLTSAELKRTPADPGAAHAPGEIRHTRPTQTTLDPTQPPADQAHPLRCPSAPRPLSLHTTLSDRSRSRLAFSGTRGSLSVPCSPALMSPLPREVRSADSPPAPTFPVVESCVPLPSSDLCVLVLVYIGKYLHFPVTAVVHWPVCSSPIVHPCGPKIVLIPAFALPLARLSSGCQNRRAGGCERRQLVQEIAPHQGLGATERPDSQGCCRAPAKMEPAPMRDQRVAKIRMIEASHAFTPQHPYTHFSGHYSLRAENDVIKHKIPPSARQHNSY